jgi:hypothetical protein
MMSLKKMGEIKTQRALSNTLGKAQKEQRLRESREARSFLF